MKSFRLYGLPKNWRRRDTRTWLGRSAIYFAIGLALLFLTGGLRGFVEFLADHPVFALLIPAYVLARVAMTVDTSLRYRSAKANPETTGAVNEEDHLSNELADE